jgi:hypothetical protein
MLGTGMHCGINDISDDPRSEDLYDARAVFSYLPPQGSSKQSSSIMSFHGVLTNVKYDQRVLTSNDGKVHGASFDMTDHQRVSLT